MQQMPRQIMINLFLLTILLHIVLSGSLTAQSEQVCKEKIQQAEQLYFNGLFEESIALLNSCIHSNELSSGTQESIWKQMSLNYLAKDYLQQARDAVGKLLDLNPEYRAVPGQDLPRFVEIVDQLRRERALVPAQPVEAELEPQPVFQTDPSGPGSKKWLAIGGGGLLVAGVVAAVLLGGGNNPPNDPGGGGDDVDDGFPFPAGRP